MTAAEWGPDHCNWCQEELSDPYIEGGRLFCDPECAEAYESEWGQ